MKKILISMFALLSLVATSCNDNKEGWDENTVNVQTSSPAILIPVTGNEEPVFVQDYALRYSQSLADGKVSVKSISTLSLPDGTSFSFESPATTVSGTQLTNIIEPLPFTGADGRTVRLRARLTQQYYNYNRSSGRVESLSQFPISLAVLNIGTNYMLKTIQEVNTFAGKTTTLINDANPYTTPDIVYELTLDIVNRKASVVLYNAKFAEAMPNIRIMRIRNLTLRADRSSGYVVEGENLVPEVLEGSEWVPNQRFAFNNFSLTPTNDNLSMASIKYRVANVYTGSCIGSYIVQ